MCRRPMCKFQMPSKMADESIKCQDMNYSMYSDYSSNPRWDDRDEAQLPDD